MVRMIHLDGLLFRLVACYGRIHHTKNHGDVRKNQECRQQGNANDVPFLRLRMLKEKLQVEQRKQDHRDARQQVREDGDRIDPSPEFPVGSERQDYSRNEVKDDAYKRNACENAAHAVHLFC